jgi:hypothetical protein
MVGQRHKLWNFAVHTGSILYSRQSRDSDQMDPFTAEHSDATGLTPTSHPEGS